MRRLYRRGLTTTSGGNVSSRDSSGRIWITPAGLDKGELAPDQVVEGRAGGAPRPSSELPLHRHLYEARPDAAAIVHAHSPGLVAFSLVHRVPDLARLPRAASFCGDVAYVPYAQTGSDDLGRRSVEAIGTGAACAILENHGAVTLGRDLHQAFQRFETLERAAATLALAARLAANPSEDHGAAAPPAEPGPAAEPPRPEPEIAVALCALARRAYQRGLLLGSMDVFSARIANGSVLITPPDADLESLQPDDLVQHDDARHQAIYATSPDLGAVIEAAPPGATAFALAGRTLSTRTIPESWLLLGDVGRLAEAVSAERPAALVANGSVIVAGRSPAEAYDRLEVLEATAQSLITAEGIATPKLLDDQAIRALQEALG